MKFNRTRLFIAFSILLTGLLIQPAIAEEIAVDAPITAVIMHRNGGAIITRSGSFTMPSGPHTVVISGLTEGMDSEYGVRAQFTRDGALVSQVRLEKKFSGKVVSAAQQAIIAQIKSLETQNTTDRASLDALKIQLDFIEKLGTNAGQKVAEGNSDPEALFAALQKSLEFVRTNSGSVILDRTNLNAGIVARDQEIQALNRQLSQTGSERKSFFDANIAASATTGGQVTLELSYRVKDAQWTVETEANLDSSSKSTTVKLFAQVSQRTGEDWTNVPLVLSTTTPSTNIKNYKPKPIYMNLADPIQPLPRNTTQRKGLQRMSAGSDDQIEELVVTGSRRKFNSTTFDAEFILGSATSVLSDGSEQRFLVSTTTADSAVVLRTTPRQGRIAYVYADTKLDGFPYLTRPSVSLTRDGTFVGNGMWPDLQPKTPLELPFGASDRIKVEVIILPRADGSSGIFGKRVNREERLQFRITNNNAVPVTMEVFDRIPNSKHEDLKIEYLKGSKSPTASNIGQQPGIVMWRETLQPGEVWDINHWYKISYPEGKRLINQ